MILKEMENDIEIMLIKGEENDDIENDIDEEEYIDIKDRIKNNIIF